VKMKEKKFEDEQLDDKLDQVRYATNFELLSIF
jgi:hypothetical protein